MRESDKATAQLRRTLLILGVAALCGAALCYLYLWLAPRHPILAPGCTLSRVTHLYCPGCGGTRAVAALLRGDIVRCLRANPIVPWVGGCAVYLYIRAWIAVWRGRPETVRIPAWTWIGLIVLALGLLVVRNWLMIAYGYDYLGDNAAFWAAR